MTLQTSFNLRTRDCEIGVCDVGFFGSLSMLCLQGVIRGYVLTTTIMQPASVTDQPQNAAKIGPITSFRWSIFGRFVQ